MSAVIRVDREVYDKLQELAESSGKSIREIVSDILRFYLLASTQHVDKEIKAIKNGFIVLRFKSRCYRCKKELEEGSEAYYVRVEYTDNTYSSRVYCLDCYFNTIPDTALLRKVRKAKELERIIKAYQRQINKLEEELKSLEVEVEWKKVLQELNLALKEFLRDFPRESLKEDIRKLLEKLDQMENRISNVEDSLKLLVKPKLKRVKEVSGRGGYSS